MAWTGARCGCASSERVRTGESSKIRRASIDVLRTPLCSNLAKKSRTLVRQDERKEGLCVDPVHAREQGRPNAQGREQ